MSPKQTLQKGLWDCQVRGPCENQKACFVNVDLNQNGTFMEQAEKKN